jgi:hypothetical protein
MAARLPASLIALALLAPLLGVAERDDRPACVRTFVVMAGDVDSAHARAGDSFQIKTVEPARAPDGTVIPPGTMGYGVVAISQHAERGGRGGYVVIETRFLALPGEHVPVTIDWTTEARASATGASRNIPGFVGAIPFVGYVLGPYGFIHHGKDVTIARDTRIPVLLGDDVAAAACRIIPPPSPSPSPAVSPSPAGPSPAGPSPAASPSPAAPNSSAPPNAM